MIEIKAPNYVNFDDNKVTLFLGGSIEMGTAEKWQDKVTQKLSHKDITILNPRRDDWDSSWIQEKNNPQFREQVLWELRCQESADIILYYFDPNTKSPITLLELGLFGPRYKEVYVCCPKGFWRKGNVDIVCEYYDIPLYENLDDLLQEEFLDEMLSV